MRLSLSMVSLSVARRLVVVAGCALYPSFFFNPFLHTWFTHRGGMSTLPFSNPPMLWGPSTAP